MGYENLRKKSGVSDKNLKRLLYGDGGDLGFDILMDIGSALGEGKLGIFKYMDMFEKMSDDEKLILFCCGELLQKEKEKVLEEMIRRSGE